MQNHIEYDEKLYDKIMVSLNKISANSIVNVNSCCSSIKNSINGFVDPYSTSGIDEFRELISNHVNQIDKLKSTINYSLLTYQVCDERLKDSAYRLIDELFSEEESALANAFKKNIMNMVEKDRNNILRYNENADYKLVANRLLPVYEYKDSEGTIWYYNSKKELIGINGTDAKITYGGEVFSVKFTENGALKLVDSKGNPIDIFGDYNIESIQYGADQNAFKNHIDELMRDDNIIRLLDQYVPNASQEDRKRFLMSISSSGCGYSSMVNAFFKELEGNEDKFLDTFGYQMYNITMGEDGSPAMVDFNYEPVLLDLYTYKVDTEYSPYLAYYGMDNIDSIVERGDGVYQGKIIPEIFNRFNEKYHLFEENYEEILERNGYYADVDFNIYYLNGEIFYENSGNHVMTKIKELDDHKWIVSSYGQKLISEVNHPTLDWKYISED